MKKIKRMSKKRLVLVLILACGLFFALTFRTGYLQIIKGDWLSTKAIDQQTREIPIEPKRGTIYDRNMKEIFVKDLKKDMEVVDFFMVKSSAIKTGANGKQYLDITLGDNSGEVSAKKWDVSEEEHARLDEIKVRDIIKVKALVTEWAGQPQLRIQRIRPAAEADGQEICDFLQAAPEDPQAMYDYIMTVAQKLEDEDLRGLCVKVLTDNREKLLYYPAAQKNHHAQLGGLLYHTKRMLMTGERVCQVYTNLNPSFVLAGVILHDMEKLNEIEAGTDGIATGYSFEGQMLGHIVQGVKMLDRVTEELGFPREKAIMLEHMILAHHYEPEYGSPKKPLFPEAEVLHYLDILDARMFDMQAALENTEPGQFSEKVRTLDNRRLYKPAFAGAALADAQQVQREVIAPEQNL